MKTPGQEPTAVRFEIAPRTIAWILGTMSAIWLLHELWIVVLLLVVALVFAGTFNPVVEAMERRRIKRGLALVILFCASIVVVSLLVFLTVPPIAEQLAEIVRGAPANREKLIALLAQNSLTVPVAHAVQNAGLEQTFAGLEKYLLGYSSQAVKVLGYFVTTVVLAFYLLADGKRTQGALYAVVPREYHMRLARILHNLERIVGGYMRGQLITSAAVGAGTLLLLVICDVPNALSLALFAALADVIPFVGGFLAAALAFLSALPRGLAIAT